MRKRVVMKDLLHFLGPMCFEKITQVSIYFINLTDYPTGFALRRGEARKEER